ncbi:chromate efflux transporter [Nesterenkonia aerolata]|uniref:Chromate efflux transporter n=1 Tax=Nesterenkonia aerolata TaxID=3074079 RepID=A0ABU2DTQ1_9MICC|nr:chromate efflux transporter [Nesterenkonia sp. LY-0111]MDR8019882.1 chromate efflux transporter [Nesterenkonia sp. LY-0111]
MSEHTPTNSDRTPERHGSVGEVFLIFLRLGLTSFGGPVAHLGYFREAFVTRRRWLTEKAYGDLVALCQFLPGPASSQVGMALGLQRAGVGGLFAAWVAFTLPSAVLMGAFAYGLSAAGDLAEAGWVLGLKAAAVAVVAHAVLGMGRSLTPDVPRLLIAAGVMAVVLWVPNPAVQILVLIGAGVLGLLVLRPAQPEPDELDSLHGGISRRTGGVLLGLFLALLAALPLIAAFLQSPTLDLADIFYRAGALVFGGGHVVLPLLEAETVQTGMLSQDEFLAGYGAAQALPGPLFTLATFLGAAADSAGLLGAIVATVAIFLPAGLLTAGALPFWEQLRTNLRARRALDGLNAGVVGILTAALITPVFTAGVLETGWIAAVIAAAGFAALQFGKVPAWAVVLGAAGIGWLVF